MIFSVEQGSFRYPGKKDLLKDLCFSVESGQILAILGPNGVGKTTLLRCMLGLLPWNSGRSLLNGLDIRRLEGRSLWQRAAYVPQSGESAAARTVLELVLLGRASRLGVFSQPGETDWNAAWQALEQLGLSQLARQPLNKLSGGQRRMAAIARALAGEPELLVLDEPEANLDLKNQLLVLETLKKLADTGMGIVLNTHDPSHALGYAQKALLLEPGGSYTVGKTAEIITSQRLSAAFEVRCAMGWMDTVYGSVNQIAFFQKDPIDCKD